MARTGVEWINRHDSRKNLLTFLARGAMVLLMKTTRNEERLTVGEIETRILSDAITCGSVARYIWAEHVERLIGRGFLKTRSEHSAEITPAGRAAFVKGSW